jgi:serine/threonine-protein kinase ULK4
VKPIVLNARIEKITETKYDKETLPFTPYTLDQVLKLSQSELEKFLTIVYKCIGGQTEVNAKVNTLCYFETLCTNTHSANMLINRYATGN